MENRFTKKIEEKVFKNILDKKLFEKGDILIISFSGGPDSRFLLHILNLFNIKYKYNLDINLMHLNHSLRKEALRDENFVKDIAEKYNFPIYIKKVDINEKAKNENIGIELAGRKERQKFLDEISEEICIKRNEIEKEKIKLVYGHHADDVCETFLLNISRGSSIRGMTSIKEKDGRKIRPILFLHKNEILEYLKQLDIDFVIDKTNFENEYARNKIRNIVIPYLEENINNKASKNIFNATQNALEAFNYIEKTSKYYEEKLIKEEKENKKEKTNTKIDNIKYFNLKDLNKLDDIILKNIIYNNISDIYVNSGVISDILNLIKCGIGKKYIDLKNRRFLIKKGKIYIINFKE